MAISARVHRPHVASLTPRPLWVETVCLLVVFCTVMIMSECFFFSQKRETACVAGCLGTAEASLHLLSVYSFFNLFVLAYLSCKLNIK